jgi:hypothetical protein
MKALLLTVALFIGATGSMFAQNFPPDYPWEAGINGGISAFTRPLGPATQYTGTRTNPVADFSLRANYFFNEHLMLGIDIGSRRWKSYGTWQENGTMGQTLSNEQVSVLVASHAINESFELNYIVPFYTKYNTYNKSNLYFGVMFGLVTTINDGSTGYGRYKGTVDSGTVYVNSINYGYGIGINYGVQLGYTYYIVPQIGVNVEVAARYADVHTNDLIPGNNNKDFYLLYFPATIGIRYRF